MREQLAQLLHNAGHEVACAECFGRLAEDTIAAAPDLIVLDLGLPGTDDIFVARELRQRDVALPTLVLTSRDTELDKLASLSSGADDFVSKSTNPQLILAHVEALLRRSGSLPVGAQLAWGGVELDLAHSRALLGGKSVELTKNELRILDVLMRAQECQRHGEKEFCYIFSTCAEIPSANSRLCE